MRALRSRGHYERAVVWAAGAVVVLALVLDRTTAPVAGPGAPRAEFTEREVARVAKRVERLRGLSFKRAVRPLFLDRDEALELVQEVSRADYPERRQRIDEEGLKLLGLLPASTDVRAVIERVDDEQLLGFYEEDSERLVVIREAGATRPLLEITLAHELVHALEDQHFGLEVPDGVPDDTVLADAALAEGTATSLMADYAREFLSTSDVLELAGLPGDSEDLPPFIEQLLLFPYLGGESFVAAFRGERGSWKPIDSIYRFRRPASSEQILHPRKYAENERPRAVTLPALKEALGAGWQRLRATPLGEYDVRLLVDLVGGTRPAAAAAGWGGGRYELWRRGPLDDGCRAPCVPRDVAVLRLDWDTEGDRREAEQQLARVWEHGLDGRRAGERPGDDVWASRGGAIAMRGAGRSLTAVLAPEPGVALRLLALSSG